MSKICIAVEGESDIKILKEISKKLNINADDFNIILPPAHSGGKSALYKTMKKIVQLHNHETIIFLVDYDNSEKEAEKFKKKKDEIQKVYNKKIYLHFSKQEIESWLLGCYEDEDALKEAKNRNPDDIKDPKALIEKCEKSRRKDDKFKYRPIIDGPKIASTNKLSHFELSQSFKEFYKILKDELNL